MTESSRKEESKQERRTRIPLGTLRKKMSLDAKTMDMLKSRGLVPRWINDSNNGNRIKEAIEGGYDFVTSDGNIIVGDAVTKENKKKRISKQVGVTKENTPLFAYLMAIKREFYEEDKEAKEAVNKLVDDAILGGKPPGLKDHGINPDYGGTNIKNIQYNP